MTPNTASDLAFAFAAGCIQTCEQTHSKCSKRPSNTWKPTRLIDIGPAGERIEPKLLLTQQIADPILYVSLSYRWGSAKMFQLTSKNLESLQREIPLHELSKVFQDAFAVYKKLGIRYIWIDSLCIV